jgi:phage gp29-like protein
MAAKKPTAAVSPSGNITQRVRSLNRWRDGFNPLRGLTIRRATQLLESYALGHFAELMWTFGAPSLGIETLDPDLSALITRRLSAIQKLDWEVKVVDDETAGFDQALADKQKAKLREVYEGIDNLNPAIAHLCMSTFRGFSFVEKYVNATGALFHLAIVNPWNIVRDGSFGEWKYDAEARGLPFTSTPGDALPMERFVARESARPIGFLALLKYIRANLGEKNWDAFLEIYGIPGGVVILPPNVPSEREVEYQDAAKQIAEGGSGSLPNGSDYKTNDSPRGNQPFKERLDHLSEKLVLAGTGGKLTMLAAPTGLGSGTSDAQADVFDDIAQAEAADISAVFQQQLDKLVLAEAFPGKPVLAYFEICAREETDTTEFIDGVAKLSTAGFKVTTEQIEEKSGYKLSQQPSGPANGSQGEPASGPFPPIETKPGQTAVVKNRAPGAVDSEALIAQLTGADSEWLAPARAKFAAIDALLSDASLSDGALLSALEQLVNDLPDLLTTDMVKPLAATLELSMSKAALNGARKALRK